MSSQLSRNSIGRIPHEASEAISKNVAVIAAESDTYLEKAINFNNAGADTATREAAEGYNVAFWTVLGIILAVVIAGFGVGLYLVRDLSRGISAIVTPMQALGSGDLAAEVTRRGENTEIGVMADALQVFKQALIAKKAADEAAARDAEAKIERARRVDGITRNFEAVVGEIVETVASAATELEASANVLTVTAERSQELAVTVAAASEEASTNVQSVASASEELSSSVNEISRQVQKSSRVASEAVDQAQQTNGRVGELALAASRIGDVVELINTIAGQTNLLALNATIEAARAGEAGRGFAVVASEVKALAQQTAKATDEISQQISGIQSATEQSVGAIKEIGDTIGRMSEISSTIAAAVEAAGRGDAGNLPQHPACRDGHLGSQLEHHRRTARRHRDRRGLGAGSFGGEVAFHREQPPQDRGREIPRTRCAPPKPGCDGTRPRPGRRNRIRWYSQPIATSTRPRHMNDSAR